MSEGMLTWSTMDSPFNRMGRTVRKGSTSSYTLVPLSQLAFPTQRLSFCSGPSYARKLDEGARVIKTGSLNELFSNSFTGDTGHEYYKRKIVSWDFGNSQYTNPSSVYMYQTPFTPWYVGTYVPAWWPGTSWWMSDADLKKESVGFLAGTAPLQSEADVLQAIVEVLREGLPSSLFSALVKNRSAGKREFVRRLSSDYLNYVFGITPVVREIDNVIRAISTINDIVMQWQRDSGLDVVRRRATPKEYFTSSFSHTASTSVFRGVGFTVPLSASSGSASFGPSVSSSSMKKWSVEETVTRNQRFSFSAAYNYNLGELINQDLPFGLGKMSSSEQSLYIYAAALGIAPSNVNASLLWELTPFSWLVDWFVNIGQMIDVSTTLNKAGLQVLFAYLTVVEELEWDQKWSYEGTSAVYNGQGFNRVKAFSMRRIRATPFGFGSSFEGLTAGQGAILAALGGTFL